MSSRGRGAVQYRADRAWCFALCWPLRGMRRNIRGRSRRTDKDAPELRAVAVLEWTGERAIPRPAGWCRSAVFDGEQLQDGRRLSCAAAAAGGRRRRRVHPAERRQERVGFFDVKNAGQEQGSWVGFGTWKPMPKPKKLGMATRPESRRRMSERSAHAASQGSGGGDSGRKIAEAEQSGPSTQRRKQPDAETGDPDRPTLAQDDWQAGARAVRIPSSGSNAGSGQVRVRLEFSSGQIRHKSADEHPAIQARPIQTVRR